MATETPSVAPPRAEVPMVDAEVVRQIRELHRGGWGAKRIARELEVARNTVRRYLRLRTVEAEIQIRPRERQLDAPARAEALRLFDGPAEHKPSSGTSPGAHFGHRDHSDRSIVISEIGGS